MSIFQLPSIQGARPDAGRELSRDELFEQLRATRDEVRRYQSRYDVTVTEADGTVRTLYRALPKQDRLHSSSSPNILFGGAAGGTKSHGIRWHGVLNCLRIPNLRVLLLRRLFAELESTHLLKIPLEIPATVGTYNDSKHRLRFTNGSILQFGHCQHDKDVTSYLSTEWDIILLDEASLFTPRQITMLLSRLRTTNPLVRRPQFVAATNPGGEAHLFLLHHFITKEVNRTEEPTYNPAEWEFIPALVTDNPYINDDYLDRLLALPHAERRAYLYGDWTVFAGQYFREWSESAHVLELVGGLVTIPEEWRVKAGMDWGFDPSPGVVQWGAFDPFGRALLYKELTFRRESARNAAQLIAGRCEREEERRMTIYGDTQMWTPQAINGVSIADEINDELHLQGTQITLERANKDRINGWARVHSYLDVRRPQPEGGVGPWLRVVRGQPETALGCPMLIQTVGAQTHDDKQTGDMKKGANDHWIESVRYLLMSEDPLTPVPVAALTEVERRKKHFQRRMETAWAEHAEHLAAEHPTPEYQIPVAGVSLDDSLATLGGGSSVADLFE